MKERLECPDCGYQCEDSPVAADDWPDGILRPVWPCCPRCEEDDGIEVPMQPLGD